MKDTILNIIQIILATLLIVAILLQQKGGGVSGIFGGGSGNVYSTKRGVDKFLHYATIGLAIVFFGLACSRLFF